VRGHPQHSLPGVYRFSPTAYSGTPPTAHSQGPHPPFFTRCFTPLMGGVRGYVCVVKRALSYEKLATCRPILPLYGRGHTSTILVCLGYTKGRGVGGRTLICVPASTSSRSMSQF
jgi:hypothetical protein